jgi:hypothetical protein
MWPQLNETLTYHIGDLDSAVKHLDNITSLSAANLERRVKLLAMRAEPKAEPPEYSTFPNIMIPFNQNERFFGREEELRKIDQFLGGQVERVELKTATIYGRRGVGKTQIAVEYAHRNPSNFDAIFWIQCETRVAIRQSFTDVASVLNIPGADKHGEHQC